MDAVRRGESAERISANAFSESVTIQTWVTSGRASSSPAEFAESLLFEKNPVPLAFRQQHLAIALHVGSGAQSPSGEPERRENGGELIPKINVVRVVQNPAERIRRFPRSRLRRVGRSTWLPTIFFPPGCKPVTTASQRGRVAWLNIPVLRTPGRPDGVLAYAERSRSFRPPRC